MTVKTLSKTKALILKSQEAQDWISDNVSLPQSAYTKDDDSGLPCIVLSSSSIYEIAEAMVIDELTEDDFVIANY